MVSLFARKDYTSRWIVIDEDTNQQYVARTRLTASTKLKQIRKRGHTGYMQHVENDY